jgi:hypothetical protein
MQAHAACTRAPTEPAAASPRVSAARLVTYREYRQPSSTSNMVSRATGCGRSRRSKISPGAGLRLQPVLSAKCRSSARPPCDTTP